MNAEAKAAINKLRAKLHTIPNGLIPSDQQPEVRQLLAEVWDCFKGSDEQGTEAYKLHRAENLEWDPPWLTFVLERHGAAKFGSSRAALHYWEINPATLSANIVKTGWRKLKPARNPDYEHYHLGLTASARLDQWHAVLGDQLPEFSTSSLATEPVYS